MLTAIFHGSKERHKSKSQNNSGNRDLRGVQKSARQSYVENTLLWWPGDCKNQDSPWHQGTFKRGNMNENTFRCLRRTKASQITIVIQPRSYALWKVSLGQCKLKYHPHGVGKNTKR